MFFPSPINSLPYLDEGTSKFLKTIFVFPEDGSTPLSPRQRNFLESSSVFLECLCKTGKILDYLWKQDVRFLSRRKDNRFFILRFKQGILVKEISVPMK